MLGARPIIERKSVAVADVEALQPALIAFIRGRIDIRSMADVLSRWVRGESYDLGTAESLPEKVARSLASEGAASAKTLSKRISAELDSVYHALFRLQGRQIVRCDRSRRPYVWMVVPQSNESQGRAFDGMEEEGREDRSEHG
jgi:hypothetical protein